jgi:hypothetical protein
MPVYGDYVNATVGTSETKVGTINVPAGSKIISLVVATHTTGGVVAVRLDYAGVQTPKKFLVPAMYGLGGTVSGIGVHGSQAFEIPLDEDIPSDKSIDIYAIADASSTPVYVGLKWVK